MQLRYISVLGLVLAAAAQPPERRVDPTFLRRHIKDVAAKASDISTDSCQYQPLFGAGDSEPSIVRGVARFGQVTVAPGGMCKSVSYPLEEQVYVIMEGGGLLHYGAESAPVRKHDFLYRSEE